jgi:hypothetical protein
MFGDYFYSLGKRSRILKHELEKNHQKFMKFILGLNRHTSLISLYGETGRYPLVINMICNSLRYLDRVRLQEESSLLYQCWRENESFNHKSSLISNLSTVIGKPFNPALPLNKNLINKVGQNLRLNFRNYWHDKIHDDSNKEYGNKLRGYRKYKLNFHKEQYLDSLWYFQYRSDYAKLRLSTHNLHIESGRHVSGELRLSPDKRICKFYTLNECEDEIHFITRCPKYDDLRQKMILNLTCRYNEVSLLSNSMLFTWLVTNQDHFVITEFAKYVHQSFELRNS